MMRLPAFVATKPAAGLVVNTFHSTRPYVIRVISRAILPVCTENGGQYTHAAIWSAWAFLELGRIEEGFELFQILNPILHADTLKKPPATGLNRMWLQQTCMALRPSPGKAVGRGIRGLPAGCTAWALRRSWD